MSTLQILSAYITTDTKLKTSGMPVSALPHNLIHYGITSAQCEVQPRVNVH